MSYAAIGAELGISSKRVPQIEALRCGSSAAATRFAGLRGLVV
jgi:hypothetical protein